MEKKIYEKPELISVIDLDDEICDVQGETRLRIVNDANERVDGIPVVSESDIDWNDGWNLAKKSTIWDDEDED